MRGILGSEPAPSGGFPERPLTVVRTPRAASLNLTPQPANVEYNLRLAERAATEARRAHPELQWVVLPELYTTSYSGLASIHRHAEDARRGRSARRFTALAQRLNVHVAYGFPELLPDGGISDSANLVGPEGVLLTYRKHHLVRATAEDRAFVAGTQLPVVEAGGAKVALVICWDLGFPHTVRKAALAGAQLILSPAGWRHPWGPQYDLSCAARALDNAVYLASANQLGAYPEATFDAPGGVYGPDGARISERIDTTDGVLNIASLDPDLPERWRRFYGCTICEEPTLSLPPKPRPVPEDLGAGGAAVMVG